MNPSTIAAIATPPGQGGIGIIRLSGPLSLKIGQSVFYPGKPVFDAAASCHFLPFRAQSRHLCYGRVIDPESSLVIDEVMFVAMPGPRSYTGEDVVEIQCHAGPAVLRKILSLLIRQGATLAAPGEFTRRAFLNGRIDLTQAEAIADMIQARSEKAVDVAAAQLSGSLKTAVRKLRSGLLDILTQMEAAIDFPEDVDEEIHLPELRDQLIRELIAPVRQLIQTADQNQFFRDGIKIVIIGAPNVGKSSLMNRLLEKERAIIDDIPGTTRDFIEDAFIVNGQSVVLTDTAGIHQTPDLVEQQGIERAWEHISRADILLYVVDATTAADPSANNLFDKLSRTGKTTIVVINKMDLPADQQQFQLPDLWQASDKVASVRVSAKYGQEMGTLKQMISDLIYHRDMGRADCLVPNLRHRLCLETALAALETSASALDQQLPPDLVSIDLQSAFGALSEITGDAVTPEILDAIFSRFCIGK